MGIKECPFVPGRMESFNLQDRGIAIIDYAHTPDSYNKVMITLKELQGNSMEFQWNLNGISMKFTDFQLNFYECQLNFMGFQHI